MNFPEAGYFIAASRLRPGLDGGYTVAAMRRALDFARHGGVRPELLTVDFWPDYPAELEAFRRIGLADETTVLRNLYEEARDDAGFLRAAARAVTRPLADAAGLVGEVDRDSAGRPWRVIARDGAGAIRHTDYLDREGRPLLRLPYISGRADWHLAEVEIEVFGNDGAVVGVLDGFGGLYRSWIDHVVAGSGFAQNVVVSEARQLGELLVRAPRDYRLVHTVHNAHTSPPYRWDSPMDALWTSWFSTVHDYDAVVWLTEAQRADAERRFGTGHEWVVVPHPCDADPTLPAISDRELDTVVMVSRLAEQKRVDDAVRAWPAVLAARPGARLEVYGGGPLAASLEALAAELGVSDRVTFHGHVADTARPLRTAAALLLTSRYEGQGLVIGEALSHGCPVIAYDINYGPRELIEDGVTGTLVAAGEVAALSAAVLGYLGHADRVAEVSEAGWRWARRHDAAAAMSQMRALFARLLDG